jgi:hypothetical protein
VQLKAGERNSTPYYVKVRIKALGSTPPPGTSDDPDVTLDAVDDRGQQQSNIIFLGTFQLRRHQPAETVREREVV